MVSGILIGPSADLNDADLTGLLLGMTLGTLPEEIYRALIEATAFGTRTIIEAFEERGIFNPDTALRFASAILEKGGSRDAMEAFVEFRGRKPQIEPLLKQLGLAA